MLSDKKHNKVNGIKTGSGDFKCRQQEGFLK
jgi:hypothetical protein